jgi:hypothetical protein
LGDSFDIKREEVGEKQDLLFVAGVAPVSAASIEFSTSGQDVWWLLQIIVDQVLYSLDDLVTALLKPETVQVAGPDGAGAGDGLDRCFGHTHLGQEHLAQLVCVGSCRSEVGLVMCWETESWNRVDVV